MLMKQVATMNEKVNINSSKRFVINKYCNNQDGFSLIEMIVVIAIITVVTSAVLIGFSAVRAQDATKASKSIAQELTALRLNTLSVQGECSLEIINNNGTYVIYMYRNGLLDSKKDYGKRIQLSYHEGNMSPIQLGAQEKLVVTFKSGSGTINDIKRVQDENILNHSAVDDGTSLRSGYQSTFVISVKGKNNGTDIKLAYETGKVFTSPISN